MMNQQQFYKLLLDKFPYELTLKQGVFLQQIADFTTNEFQDELFVLKGYAGTGKTTLLSVVVNELKHISKSAVMLAPTGRAAKVISLYSGRQAFTIHKHIYYTKASRREGGIQFTMRNNKHRDTIFIVDEASMISDSGSSDSHLYPNGSLLDDLIYYVYSGRNCKLILIGDTAQLPPVNMPISPALDIDRLGLQYQMKIQHIELDEVMRQEENSGILHNATLLRSLLKSYFADTFQFEMNGFKDIVRLQDGYDIQDAIFSAYSNSGPEETAFIVRSNKRANAYNQQIRLRILDKENEISAGDLLMVVKNNYYWLKSEADSTNFIANGDIIEILEIYKIIELYNFRYASVRIRMIDYPDMASFDTIVLLDTLTSESPALTYEQTNKLYQEIMLDYEDEITKYKKVQKVKQNEYFNALQVKFSYAITCHKSQGGQWETVFVEQPYLPEGVDMDYIRWLYTAMTRAKNKLYLIGFKDDFFEN
jgi:exodeoxyribonuclease-5